MGARPETGAGVSLTSPRCHLQEGHTMILTSISVHGCDEMKASACRANGAAWLNLRVGKSQAEVIQIYMDYDRADTLAEYINSGEKAWLRIVEDEADYLASRETNNTIERWKEAAQ